MAEIKFLKYVCLEKYQRRVGCKAACSLVFPDTPEHREIARKMYTQLRNGCVMKDVLHGLPRLVDPDAEREKMFNKDGAKYDGTKKG